MKHTLQIASLLCLLPVTHGSIAQTYSDGYIYDSRAVVVRDGSGNCVRTTRWSSANAVVECDPGLFKQAATREIAAPPAAKLIAEPAANAALVTPASAKHVPVKISLGADESFDLNKAELKPAAKRKLGELAKQMSTVEYGQFVVVGHADRTGSKSLNQPLSERRANTVHNYLVSEGVPANKIASSGAGSNQPITGESDCAKLKGKKLQACLAPDRRVDITVTGIHAK